MDVSFRCILGSYLSLKKNVVFYVSFNEVRTKDAKMQSCKGDALLYLTRGDPRDSRAAPTHDIERCGLASGWPRASTSYYGTGSHHEGSNGCVHGCEDQLQGPRGAGHHGASADHEGSNDVYTGVRIRCRGLVCIPSVWKSKRP